MSSLVDWLIQSPEKYIILDGNLERSGSRVSDGKNARQNIRNEREGSWSNSVFVFVGVFFRIFGSLNACVIVIPFELLSAVVYCSVCVNLIVSLSTYQCFRLYFF